MVQLKYEEIDFTSFDQSLLATGRGSFDEVLQAVSTIEINPEPADNFIFKLDVDLDVSLGIEIGARGSIGGIDTALSYEPTATIAGNLRGATGAPIVVFEDTAAGFVAGAFSTDPLGLELYSNLLYRLQGKAIFSIFGNSIIDSPNGGYEFPTRSSLPNDDGLGRYGLFNIDANRIGLIQSPLGEGNFMITQPLADTFLSILDRLLMEIASRWKKIWHPMHLMQLPVLVVVPA